MFSNAKKTFEYTLKHRFPFTAVQVLEGDFRGWSGLFRGGFREVSNGKLNENNRENEENYTEKNFKKNRKKSY